MPQITNPVKAIRANCLECSGGSSDEVKKCQIPDCPLFPFRYGKNPFRTPRTLSEDQKAAARERLTIARNTKRAGGHSGA